jgi:hypothetical protein
MNYIARFQGPNGYYDNLDNATFEQAIKFLNHNVSFITDYKMASIVEKGTGREVFSYRTIK